MCDMRYFRRAYHKLVAAKQLMANYEWDELFITDVEYYLQQCVEFTVKAFLECKGLSVPETHQISKLLHMVKNNGSTCIITEWISKHAIELTEWEAQSKYNFDYFVELDLVKEGIVEVENFLRVNGLHEDLEEELTEERKERLRGILSKNCKPKDDFEWNVYYHVFMNKLG